MMEIDLPESRMWHNHCQADLTATNRSRYYHALSLANYLTVSHSPLVCLSTPRIRFRDHFHILIIYHITLLVDIFRTAERFNCFHSPKFIWPPSAQWKEIYWTLVINFRIREEMCNKSSDGELFWSIIIHVELMLQTKKKTILEHLCTNCVWVMDTWIWRVRKMSNYRVYSYVGLQSSINIIPQLKIG